MKLYKLKFLSSFHLDSGDTIDGPSETFIRSDTLFSAICSAAQKLYDKEISEKLINSNLKMSSAFPYYYDELFFPRPLNYFPALSNYDLQKAFKKIRFVSEKHLLKLINKEKFDQRYFDEKEAQKYILNGCWMAEHKRFADDKIFDAVEMPHIVLDRVSNSTQIFYKTEVHFNQNSGLFFLADIDRDFQTKFDAVLRFLGDEGIGADRTVGKGLFEVKEISDFSFPKVDTTDSWLFLSLYSPLESEVNNILPEESFYDFEIRKGWVSNNTLNRKAVRMFTEGSVIKTKNSTLPEGELKVVLSKNDYKDELSYDIYRNGRAFVVPISGGINEIS